MEKIPKAEFEAIKDDTRPYVEKLYVSLLGTSPWWLRDRGAKDENYASIVQNDGLVDSDGHHVHRTYYGIRPAIKYLI